MENNELTPLQMTELSLNEGLPKPPVEHVLDIISGKWQMVILHILGHNGTLRHGELKRKIPGITNTMLSQSLKQLEDFELINRVQYNVMPLKVEYSLTDMGVELLDSMTQLAEWGRRHMKMMEDKGMPIPPSSKPVVDGF